MTPFPCTSCGVCCRHVDRLHASAAFPYANTNGVCEKLGSDDRCTVYEDRPLACRVDALGAALGVGRAEWHALTATLCNQIQRTAGLPSRWRVVLRPVNEDQERAESREVEGGGGSGVGGASTVGMVG